MAGFMDGFGLRSRMKLPVHLAQTRRGDMRINFRRADAGMAEQFLDDPQVCAMLEQMRRETVPQHVRSDVSSNPRAPDPLFDPQPECHRGKGGAAPREKHIPG